MRRGVVGNVRHSAVIENKNCSGTRTHEIQRYAQLPLQDTKIEGQATAAKPRDIRTKAVCLLDGVRLGMQHAPYSLELRVLKRL